MTAAGQILSLSPSEGERAGVRGLFIAFLLLSLPASLCGAVNQAWVARYNNGGLTVGTDTFMALDSQGNILVAGHGTSTNGDYDYLILKYSPNGTEQWTARYNSGPGSNDQVRAMAVDAEGNIYVTGTSRTVKYSSTGVLQWVAPYGGRSLALDPHGDVCLTGFSEVTFATARIDKDVGTNLWLRTYSYLSRPGYPDISEAIAVDSRSNIYVGGHVYCHTGRPEEVYQNRLVVGYDTRGNQIMLTVPVPDCYIGGIRTIGIGVDSGGNVYDTINADGANASIMKYGPDGTVQWMGYGSYVDYGLRAMVMDSNGFIYLTGKSAVPGPNIGTDKISPFGSNVWTSGYFGNTFRCGNAVTVNGAGNVFVAGLVRSSTTGDDYVTIKYDKDGHEQWAKLYNGPGNGSDVASAIAVAPEGSVYVSGTSANTNGVLEITTIKYVQYQPISWQPGATVLLEFPAAPGQSVRFQASTNLTTWQDIATVLASPDCIARYTDTTVSQYPHRFYRLAVP